MSSVTDDLLPDGRNLPPRRSQVRDADAIGRNQAVNLLVTIPMLLVASCLAWLPAAFGQPMQVGPEFQVNTYTRFFQGDASVASDAAGNFVVVWQSDGSAGSDTDGFSVQGQRYDSTGTPQGAQFQVNSYTTDYQGDAAVAVDPDGDFIVVWKSIGSAGSDSDGMSIHGQRYNSAGTPQGDQFQVNAYTTDYQGSPAVAADAGGAFVVVWESSGSVDGDTSYTSIQARRFGNDGLALGGQFQVNTYTTDGQFFPKVAVAGDGSFVVVWRSDGSAGSDTDSTSIQGRRYDGTGTPQGGEFQVNAVTTNFQDRPVVARSSAGDFVVAWVSYASEGSDLDNRSIQARRYDGGGASQGGQFQVNSYTTGSQTDPAVAIDAAGNFVVVWDSSDGAGSDTDGLSIQGQRFETAGIPLGGQFQVNGLTADKQWYPVVAADDAGNFVVAWPSDGGRPDKLSVRGRQFVPTGALPGIVAAIKPGTLAKFIAKPADATLTPPAADPTIVGGSLRFFDASAAAGDESYNLPAPGWKVLGTPASEKGYKYVGAGTVADPCKVILVKGKIVKGVCRGAGVMLTPPFAGDVIIVLTLGTADRYCAQFGGDEVKNDATLTKRKNAPAPTACP